MDSKTILFISPQPFFQWRGSPIRVKFNLLALTAAGYEVHLLTLPVGEDLPIPGVTVHRVANPFRVKQVPIGPNAWKLFFDLLLLARGFRLCRKHRYAVIHGIEEAGFLAVLLAKWFKARSIFEVHSDPFSYRGGALKNALLRLYTGVEKWTARRADAVIGTGAGLAEQVKTMCPGAATFHIPDIPSSTEAATEAEGLAVRAQLHIEEDEVVILYVGSFAVYQGVDLLFAAIPEVVRHAARARFVIIGGNASQIEDRRRRLQEQGLTDHVILAGTVDPDRLPAWLVASDLLLSPRISGINTPLKVLDYMKAGRAIVATDIPANRLLLNEQTAAFAPPDAAAFARRIVDLVGDREERVRLGAAGRRRFEEEYTLEQHKTRLSACYAQILGESPAPKEPS